MTQVTKNCGHVSKDGFGLKITFNKAAGIATLHGTLGTSTPGYSYKLSPIRTEGTALHLNLEIINPTGPQFCVGSAMDIKSDFAISAKTTDVYVHMIDTEQNSISWDADEDGALRREYSVLHCKL